MLSRKKFFIAVFCLVTASSFAQKDTTPPKNIDSFLLRQKGIIGDLARNLLADTTPEDVSKELERNDQAFKRYNGLIIRKIVFTSVHFGMSVGDTTKSINNKLTKFLNHLHKNTRENVVRNNLFFHEGEKLSPYLVGINERHLRDLIYLQDARIRVQRARGTIDSVDVFIITKDAFSLGGAMRVDRLDKFEGILGEDNLFGTGDRLQVQGLYDGKRMKQVGTGAEYVKRNMRGSFTDFYAGYRTYSRSFSNNKPEEITTYAGFIKPLVHPLMQFTYAAEASMNQTENHYSTDSIYKANYRYRYGTIDAWAGWNLLAMDKKVAVGDRLNWLVGFRILRNHFYDRPLDYLQKYFYRYIDFKASLASLSVFHQDYYRTKYIYGFGRFEDVPEGVDASVTAGWTKSNDRVRPYAGIDYKRYFFTAKEAYFNLGLRTGGYFYKGDVEDLTVMATADYFSRLHTLSPKWKQRSFINTSIAKQFNYQMSEPLLVNTEYGIPGYNNDNTAGDSRITMKLESVFFSPWRVLYFNLAPFVFGQATAFHINEMGVKKDEIYSAVGGGLRIQNESLVFGTIEIRGAWYPKPDFNRETYRIAFSTDVRFRYNKQFIKRPELVSVNNSQVRVTRER
jgi:hypothetical protein